jgi:hypothetical protein
MVLLVVVISPAGCGSGPAPGESQEGGAPSASPERRDAGAMADLQASATWSAPRCRWLETGAWILAYPQDTALYRAAHDLGYIEMEEVGQGNRIGVPEPAWRIALTDEGRAEAAKCPASSKSTVWGVPVSYRRFTSGTHVGEDAGVRTVYEVEYDWEPTAVGGKVKHVLTDKMTVEEGTYRTKVYMRKGRDLIAPGPNGWMVVAIDDFAAVRLQ